MDEHLESPAPDAPADAVAANAPITPAETPEATPAEQLSARAREPRLPLPGSLQEIVGSLLFASPVPLSAADIRACVRGVEPEEGDDRDVMDVYKTCTNREIEEALRGVAKALEVAGVGFRLVCSGGAYRMQTAPNCGRYVRALLKLDRPARLSRASLETLAIVAYRQPITKAEIEEIRGVGVDTMIKTLVDLQLVRLVGRSELPGHPFLYGTTPLFLEHFGLASLDQLNEIDPTLPRSDPRARAKLFKKEEKPEPEKPTETPAAEAPAAAPADTSAEAPAATSSVPYVEPVEGAESTHVSFGGDEDDADEPLADDDEPLIDDTPDEFDDEDDDEDDAEPDDAASEGDGEEES